MRIITVEEHFEHPEVSARVLQLGGPPSGLPLEGLAEFGSIFNDDRDAATRLDGHRLAHMDAVGVDVQVVSHGNGSPSTLAGFLTDSGLSDQQMHAIGHANVEALLRI